MDWDRVMDECLRTAAFPGRFPQKSGQNSKRNEIGRKVHFELAIIKCINY